MAAGFEICFQALQFGITFDDVIDDLLLEKIHVELLVQGNTQVFEVIYFNDRGACSLWFVNTRRNGPFMC